MLVNHLTSWLVVGGSTNDGLYVSRQIWNSCLTVGLVGKQYDDGDDLNDEFQNADDEHEHADSQLAVVISVPSDAPVYYPNRVCDERESHQVP